MVSSVTPSKGDFVTMLLRPILDQCETNSCVIEFAEQEGIIADASPDIFTKQLTKYEAGLILWRSYLVV